MGIVKMNGYKCDRCNHLWVPRSKIEELPTICPRCKSPYWNIPRGTSRPKKISLNRLVRE